MPRRLSLSTVLYVVWPVQICTCVGSRLKAVGGKWGGGSGWILEWMYVYVYVYVRTDICDVWTDVCTL